MNIAESFISALQSIKANKMRSFLTMLGIIIGISSVITIVSIGQGGKEAIMGEFDDLGTNVINVSVKSLDNEIEERDYLTLKDAQLIKDKIPEVTAVVPAAGTMGYMKTDKEKKFAEIDCITHEFNKLMKVEILAGRFLSEGDIEAARNVIVIDEITANKLFKGPKDAVGQRIKVTINDNNTNFTIIGVSETTGGSMAAMFGDNYPGLGYVPITLRERIMPKVQISWFSVLLESMDNSKEVATKIVRLLEQSTGMKGSMPPRKASRSWICSITCLIYSQWS